MTMIIGTKKTLQMPAVFFNKIEFNAFSLREIQVINRGRAGEEEVHVFRLVNR